jgi:alpha-L-fucosidase
MAHKAAKLYVPLFCLLLVSCTKGPQDRLGGTDQGQNIPAWFKDSKFGMFIHWGPYSVLGGEWKGERIEQGDVAEWIMQRFQIPVEEYRKVAATFNPTGFDAREWVSLAKKTGMKYIIITSKHHDGFAMYESGVSGYNIVDHTPFKRDPLRELSEACAEAGIKFCVYYSHREDWEHPYAYGNFWDFDSSQTNLDTMDHPELFRRYLDEKAIPQLKELLTGYGPLGIVWFDRGMYTQEQGREFADLVHDLQPGCLVNGRVGHYDKELLGDYQSMTDNGMPIGGIEEYWETPQTLNETWGYSRFDQNWKTPDEVIRRLVSIVSKGGNYLLNVGPTGEGIIPAPSVKILIVVGDWMQKNSESIYGTSPSPFPYELPWGYCTRKGSRLFLHVFDWPGNGKLSLKGLNNTVEKAYSLLDPDEAFAVDRDEAGGLMIGLPAEPPDRINSVFVLEIKGDPDINPFIVEQDEDGSVLLDYLSASTSGKAQKRFNRRGESGHFHISKMQTPGDAVEWHVRMAAPGTYDVDITYAARPGWENAQYILEMGQERIEGTVKSTEGWYEYKTERIGRLDVSKAGRTVAKIYPKDPLDHYLMYYNKIELKPVVSQTETTNRSPRIVNIINFIRQCEPRIEWITEDVLYETVVEQINILKKHRLKATFLLQYDALIDARYQKLLKGMPEEMFEIGAWWEIPQPLVEKSGFTWRGRYPWDWHADVGFATGYSPDEREKLVETYMADFKRIFGRYPKSVGSWFIDAHTLNYMHDRYGIVASCNCKDQIGTDGYTLWGGYWSQAYYPSRENAYMPAQNVRNQIPVPVFRMLGSDPIHQYDSGLGTDRQRVISLEPVYERGGGDAEWCRWYFDAFVEGEALGFAYTQTGQENSFTWKRMGKGYAIQMRMLAELLEEGKVAAQTLGETGAWFKERYRITPPTSVTALNDHSEKNLKTVWFNSRFFRANLLWDQGTMRFRDIHLFDESVASDYLTERGTSSQCFYSTLPVVDGFSWSSSETVAGLRFMSAGGSEIKGGDPSVENSSPGELKVRCPVRSPDGEIVILFNETTLSISASGGLKDNWFLELSGDEKANLPFVKINGKTLSCTFKGAPYSVSAIQGDFTLENGFVLRIIPESNLIVLDFSKHLRN